MFSSSARPAQHAASPIEWGPAHLREDAAILDVEPTDRPDDN
jgi:hypothetical protein